MSAGKANPELRMAVRIALGRFRPTRMEELYARVQVGVQLEQQRLALRRMAKGARR